ncbi:helix-turn-helix transcriptional regulator [Achromobacter insolitus]|uniref:helix-turn-helix domain-containing protein n=1 Tax=Achromobacter TaxID=222 RepID=UPI00177C16DD|nr:MULTISPECIES: helix-turn-helix transcriptional regulator [Achromobacter]MBD9475219.1 helix-turn-helix domain-containing protein [Achromobacter sp. ACM01]MDH3066632.1 helix-turn-helix transcriptional regulator [Achromobacter insolitus]
MKVRQNSTLTAEISEQLRLQGRQLARLRHARRIKQIDAALRAGLSRNTAYRIERGDGGVAIGQVLRYLDAIVPGATLKDLLTESDPSLATLQTKEATKRVRDLTLAERQELDF